MKKTIFFITCLIICTNSYSKKRALLIGIGSYPQNSGWNIISSGNDINILEEALKNYYFDIDKIQDKQATRKNIEKSIEKLKNECAEGDTVLIHFSCHGQQVLSNRSEDEEPDRLDEALVPYDAGSTINESYLGENHLLDHDLAVMLDEIRKKLGDKGLLLVSLDACYSGSSQKSPNDKRSVVYRGGREILGFNTISEDSLSKIIKVRNKSENDSIEKKLGYSDLIIISACKSYQKSHEIQVDSCNYGPLSHAMYIAFKDRYFNDIEQWLHKVDTIMQEESSGFQKPSIIGTIKFQEEETPKKEDPVIIKENNNRLVFGAIAFVILLMCFGLWKMKKK